MSEYQKKRPGYLIFILSILIASGCSDDSDEFECRVSAVHYAPKENGDFSKISRYIYDKKRRPIKILNESTDGKLLDYRVLHYSKKSAVLDDFSDWGADEAWYTDDDMRSQRMVASFDDAALLIKLSFYSYSISDNTWRLGGIVMHEWVKRKLMKRFGVGRGKDGELGTADDEPRPPTVYQYDKKGTLLRYNSTGSDGKQFESRYTYQKGSILEEYLSDGHHIQFLVHECEDCFGAANHIPTTLSGMPMFPMSKKLEVFAWGSDELVQTADDKRIDAFEYEYTCP